MKDNRTFHDALVSFAERRVIRMRLIIGADIVPTKINYDFFINANIEELFGQKLLAFLKHSDYRIFNLETPLVDIETPIQKFGPTLSAPTSTINGIKEIAPSLITLANNHIMDQGVNGLNSTRKVLSDYNIPFFGVGDNIDTVNNWYCFEKENIKVGFLTFAENEFSIASEDRAGAVGFDPLSSFDILRSKKKECDYIIVLFHGGKEHFRYPSPWLQKVCRKFVSEGASIVVTQHSHCIGCMEKYENGTIIYGQGNFIFKHLDNEFWKTSLLLDIEANRNNIQVDFVPLEQTDRGVILATDGLKKKILDDFYRRSEEIKDSILVREKYQKFAKEMLTEYKYAMGGKFTHNIIFRCLNKLSGHRLPAIFYRKKELLPIYDYMRCESQYDLMIEGIRNELEGVQNCES